MAWVYYLQLVDSRFQAKCLEARLRQNTQWFAHKEPEYVAIYRTPRGKYGVKLLM